MSWLVKFYHLPRISPIAFHVINDQELTCLKSRLKNPCHVDMTCTAQEMAMTLWMWLMLSLWRINSTHTNVSLAVFDIPLHWDLLINQPTGHLYARNTYSFAVTARREQIDLCLRDASHCRGAFFLVGTPCCSSVSLPLASALLTPPRLPSGT